MRRPAQTLDVADVLTLDGGLPGESNAQLAAEALVVSRLVAEHARQNVVPEHRRGLGFHERQTSRRRLGQRSGMPP
jgi:hypothetical protein